MDIIDILYEISLKIIVIGGAISIILLVFILFRVLLLVGKISRLISDVVSMYFFVKNFFMKPFKILKKR